MGRTSPDEFLCLAKRYELGKDLRVADEGERPRPGEYRIGHFDEPARFFALFLSAWGGETELPLNPIRRLIEHQWISGKIRIDPFAGGKP
jgi:hypothetical protein